MNLNNDSYTPMHHSHDTFLSILIAIGAYFVTILSKPFGIDLSFVTDPEPGMLILKLLWAFWTGAVTVAGGLFVKELFRIVKTKIIKRKSNY